MKKLNSLEELGSLIPDGFKTKKSFDIGDIFSKQNLEAHYSIKGRTGVPCAAALSAPFGLVSIGG